MLRRWLSEVDRRERTLLVAAILLGLAVRVGYVLITGGHHLTGDEPEYDIEGRFLVHGHFLWSTTPYGIAHASMWKAPIYPAWVGVWYALIGH
ncbi:MAG TPA: hypothetical protein VHE14_07270, partial [Solirubrobacteraceae bacterium]|nr:hypothetical protein [Solirubrobacteraceae bacterium]